MQSFVSHYQTTWHYIWVKFHDFPYVYLILKNISDNVMIFVGVLNILVLYSNQMQGMQ
jgi:hypothetical protein